MKKIILIESDPYQINLYRRVFAKTGFDVELATTKEEMLEELRQIRNGDSAKPDLVLLDFVLSDGHGVEILKAIKKNFLTKEIPVFAVTNYQNPDLERQMIQSGVMPEKYLVKAHHTPAQMIKTINNFFEKEKTDQIKTILS